MKRRCPASHPNDESRWQAVRKKDRDADGLFFFAVRTTGIYCRPSCPARSPRRENVVFFDTVTAAEKAGFRACKRCHPKGASQDVRRVELVERACREIQESDTLPGLAVLAKATDLSPHHFHRIFKEVTGLTPKGYASALRADRMRSLLPQSKTVTDAIYEAGFQSSGRFYEVSERVLGMKPEEYRCGGPGKVIHFEVASCSLGYYLAAASEKGLCAILMGDDPQDLIEDLKERFSSAELKKGDKVFRKLLRQVAALIDEPSTECRLPLDIRGTVFQCRVWEALRQIPAGTTVTYSAIAQSIGAPKAIRAVAGACAANALAVAIPCHRVKRRDGSFSGYRWGVERKRALLKKEAEA